MTFNDDLLSSPRRLRPLGKVLSPHRLTGILLGSVPIADAPITELVVDSTTRVVVRSTPL
jgi:hypothetical protein